MTAREFKDILARLETSGGPSSDRQVALWFGLSEKNGDRSIRRYRNGEQPISGPIALLAQAFDEGWRPPCARDTASKVSAAQ